MNSKLLYQFIVLFLVTNAIGLLVAHSFIRQDVTVTVISDDKESLTNSVGLFVYIMFATGLLLVFLKYFSGKSLILFKILEGIAIYYTASIVLWAGLSLAFKPEEFQFLPEFAAIILIVLRNAIPEHVAIRNIVTVLLASGIGALIGTGIGTIPIAIFLAAMSIYDYIAVFKTKHMVTLAKAVTQKNLAFTFAMPTPEHQFELGTGDLVLPLAFAVSVLHVYAAKLLFPVYFIPSIVILLASFAGLFFTLQQSSSNVGKPLPALPLQTILMLIVFAAITLAFP